MTFYLFAVVFLICLAISDLIVGVSNDAVNFLNSSFGSRVSSRRTIMIIASLGILAGVTFSSGMMEVARKGIFNPRFFTMPELMVLFLGVMLTDILLLDLFNTFGLPTSTTVSIVFELLGAAVALALFKVMSQPDAGESISVYINSAKAITIIIGILLSVVIAFFFGALIMFLSRLIFTFNYEKRIKRFGALWGGAALAMIAYFILIKGAKGASFITDDVMAFIKTHTLFILGICFTGSAVILQGLILFTRVNIFKPIILIGTFALAMAFAANDLVNFIGVPLAGFTAYMTASADSSPLTLLMEELQKPAQTNTFVLLFAGIIMVATLWLSRKARTVTETEINLGRQDEGIEQFGSTSLSRVTVRMFSTGFKFIKSMLPEQFNGYIAKRLNLKDAELMKRHHDGKEKASFDLLRASVNLMVASAIVSFATSLKLPLSTTYVTFMVAMGTSLSDQAWGRESAVYRVSGVLMVVGGWFFTAFMAFTVSFIFASSIYFSKGYALFLIIVLIAFLIWRNHHLHLSRVKEKEELNFFDLRKVKDEDFSIQTIYHQNGIFLDKVCGYLKSCFYALFNEDRIELKSKSREMKKIQNWANVIVANIFKTLRLLEKADKKVKQDYAMTIGSLQEIAESLRDIVMRSYLHVNNHHKGLLEDQQKELSHILSCITDILGDVSHAFKSKKVMHDDIMKIKKKNKKLQLHIEEYNHNQIVRIQEDISKTRLSILFYALIGNVQKISEHSEKLLKIFFDSFSPVKKKKGK